MQINGDTCAVPCPAVLAAPRHTTEFPSTQRVSGRGDHLGYIIFIIILITCMMVLPLSKAPTWPAACGARPQS